MSGESLCWGWSGIGLSGWSCGRRRVGGVGVRLKSLLLGLRRTTERSPRAATPGLIGIICPREALLSRLGFFRAHAREFEPSGAVYIARHRRERGPTARRVVERRGCPDQFLAPSFVSDDRFEVQKMTSIEEMPIIGRKHTDGSVTLAP